MAERLGLRSISDLARHPELSAAFSSGFTDRDDGWPGLRRHYGLELAHVRVMEHALTYEALVQGEVDVIDIYSTDGKLERLDLTILEDDRAVLPRLPGRPAGEGGLHPAVPPELGGPRAPARGADRRAPDVPSERPRRPRRAELPGRRGGVLRPRGLGPSAGAADWSPTSSSLTFDHLYLVLVSLGVAILLGVPLGIVAARHHELGQVELMAVGVLQTIPSLALLCFMIPLLGIGKLPSLVALALYALLPIVRNTYTGLISIDRQLLEIAGVLGLDRWQRLARIELPLASLHILSGIKTAAVWTVGTATLAAFIGGGGYGDLIVRGLALDDVSLILAGAVPAALMALVFHAAVRGARPPADPEGAEQPLRGRLRHPGGGRPIPRTHRGARRAPSQMAAVTILRGVSRAPDTERSERCRASTRS